ncbi:2TM domain-containing protein [uncultured Maribacter sp.]|uniref:2TM domain-containing protein n=1 Tax=uncultured Maribacter sp. TaxID=431308 RepID=UPI002613BE45|nr:2TM domain-containing protein [uncultured Maribacter sp.]
MKTLHQEGRYLRAKERVQEEKSFYSNLTAYCLVIPMLGLVNFYTSGFYWVVFPALGWGLGLILHAMKIFGFNLFLGRNWEERKIAEYMKDDI